MAFTLAELSELDAVSGCEDEARVYIISNIKGKCDKLEVDSLGNVIAFKKGKSDKHTILLGTNIDEVGFIVSDITEKGFIKFKAVGNIDPRTLVSKTVRIGKNRIPGVIGMKAIHLQKKAEREASVKVSDLYIDIGAYTKKEAEKIVSLGDYIAFNTEYSESGERIKGKALDRFGVVPLIYAMESEPLYDTYFVFSSQREILCSIMGRGMKVASYKIKPDYALIVSTVNTDDSYNAKNSSAHLGKGAIIEFMDKTSVSDTMFTNELSALAERNDISAQKKTSSAGTSVAGAVVAASYGATVATVSVPCRYSHSPVCYMNKNDIMAVSKICAAFIRESDVVINGITKKTN